MHEGVSIFVLVYIGIGSIYICTWIYVYGSIKRIAKYLKDWLGWVGFYDISTLVGYLIPNPLYTFLKIYMIWFGLVL